MRIVCTLVALVVPSTAIGAPMAIEGRVIDAHSRWTGDGSRIVTTATVRTATGDDVTVSQLGGSVDGLTMRTFPGPEIMVPGMRVAIAAHAAPDLAQRSQLVVDDARVLEMPAGFVRTGPTRQGHFLFWESGCVFVTPDATGTSEVAGQTEFTAIEAAVSEWNTQTAGCSYMNIVLETPVASEVGRDDRNLIKFRDTSWCRPAIADDPARCYSPQAAGITTAIFVDDANSPRDGAIVDADVELNGADFAISHNGQTTGAQQCQSEITNTLTHELGHLLGLEHPCLASGDPNRVDGDGAPVPLCSTTFDPKITEATMYNFQACGETKKASLSNDDIAAVCNVYPTAKDPGVCAPVGQASGGCCSTSGSPGAPAALTLATWLGFARRRRR